MNRWVKAVLLGLITVSVQAQSFDIENYIENLYAEVKGGVSSVQECSQRLGQKYKDLAGLRSSQVRLLELSESQLDNIIQTSFLTRLAIREQLPLLDSAKDPGEKCLTAIRDAIRALRYVEDYAGELKISKFQKPQKNYTTLTGKAPYFLINPDFNFSGVKDLKSGDVILSRGNAYSSAAIARIGRSDAQFSHLTLVYQHSNGKFYTIEAHIEVGSVVKPIQTHIDQQNARTLVYRFNDSKLAHEAAKSMYKIALKAQKSGNNIQYDFGMDYKDNKKLFCSEIIYAGFSNASAGKVDVPRYKTLFPKGLIGFLGNLGIKVNEKNVDTFRTFAPGDIDFDSRFELIAEWRNPNKLKDLRMKDAILTKMFEWIETKNYKLYPKAGISFKSGFSWLLRRTPFLKSLVKDKFPTNMTTAQLKLFLVLEKVGDAIYDYLDAAQKLKKAALTPAEMFDVLERFRVEDLARYKASRKLRRQSATDKRYRLSNPRFARRLRKNKPLFHNNFHPKKSKKKKAKKRIRFGRR